MAALARSILCSILCMGLLLPITAKPYSKYGRSCSDIGCPSTEVCVMAYDSCSYGAQENSDCGRYPTCKRREDGSKSQSSNASNRNLYSSSDSITRTSSTPTRSESGDVASFFNNPEPRPNPSPSLYPRLPVQSPNQPSPQYPSVPRYPAAPQYPVAPQYPAAPQQPAAPQYPAPQYPRQPSSNVGPTYPRQPTYNSGGQSGGYDSFSNVNRGGYVPPGYGGAGGYNPYGGYSPYGGQQPSNVPASQPQRPASIPIPPRGTSGGTNSNSDTGILSSLSGYLGGGGNAGSGISTSDVAGIIGGVIGNRGSTGPANPAPSSSGPVDGILSGISGYLGGNTGPATNNRGAQPAAGSAGGSTFDNILSGVSSYIGGGSSGGAQPAAGGAGGSTFDNILSGVSGYIGGGSNANQGQSSVGNVIGGLIGGNKPSSGQSPDIGNVIGGLIGSRGSNTPAAPQPQNTGSNAQDGGVLTGIGDFLKNNAGSFISSTINGGGVSQREIITNKKNFGLFAENPSSSSSSNSDLNVAASNRANYSPYPTQAPANRGTYNYNNNYRGY